MNAYVRELGPERIESREVVVHRKCKCTQRPYQRVDTGLRQGSPDPVAEVESRDMYIRVGDEIDAVVEQVSALKRRPVDEQRQGCEAEQRVPRKFAVAVQSDRSNRCQAAIHGVLQCAVPQEAFVVLDNPPLPGGERSTACAGGRGGLSAAILGLRGTWTPVHRRRRRRLLRRRPLSAIRGLRGTWAPARRHPLPSPSPHQGGGP